MKVLGLDLGTNSIGWAVIDKNECQILKSGVRIFPEGVEPDTIGKGDREQPKNATRREHRQARRHYYRKRLRKIKLLKLLISLDMCPLSYEELKDWSQWKKSEKSEGIVFPSSVGFIDWLKQNPYKLRSKALEMDITKQEFGRILYHLIQRRGFLSSRKGNEDGSIYTGTNDMVGINETADKLQSLTLGQYLHEIAPKENQPFKQLHKSEKVRGRYTLRSMYISEFERIWKRQAPQLNLNSVTVEVEKVRFLQESPDSKRSCQKIKALQLKFGENNVHIDGKKIVTKTDVPLKKYLAGDIYFEDETIKFKSNESILFWQRPLRSQKGLVAKCMFEGKKFFDKKNNRWIETGPTPGYLSHPDFELFRAWQFINNIQYGTKQFLDEEQKQRVLDIINSKSRDFKFSEIIKKLKLDYEQFNYSEDTSVSANKTIAQLKPLFEEDIWIKYYNEIWHLFISYDDHDLLFKKLKNDYKSNIETVDDLKKIKLTEGFSNVSLKAIRNILPFLEKGYLYHEATLLGGIKNSFGMRWDYFKDYHSDIECEIVKIIRQQKYKQGELIEHIKQYLSDENNHYGFSTDDKSFIKLYHHSQKKITLNKSKKLSEIANLRNPIVQQALNETRRLVNTLLIELRSIYGSEFEFDQINVEFGRDLKLNKATRFNITRRINENRLKNDEARDRLSEFGLKPSRENITKYLLYKEIYDKGGQVTCPYTNKTISIVDLLGRENRYQIEHIIPRSISLDDSFGNKTLCEANFNREKGELTPYQYYQKNPDSNLWDATSWKEIENRIFRILPYDKAKKFVSKADFKSESFIERQLNDTRYISKKAAEILTEICDKVHVLPGQLTAELRKLWGLNNILSTKINLPDEGYNLNENEATPHYIILDEQNIVKDITPIENQKPKAGNNEVLITGIVKRGYFHSDALNQSVIAENIPDGKAWMRINVIGCQALYPFFYPKPNIEEGFVLLKCKIKNGEIAHDQLRLKIKTTYSDGTYWVKFKIKQENFILSEDGRKPKIKSGQLAYYGQIADGLFKNQYYSGKTTIYSDGHYWCILTPDTGVFECFPMIQSRPTFENSQVCLKGDLDSSGRFNDDSGNTIFVNQNSTGVYYAILNVRLDDVEVVPQKNQQPKPGKGESLLEGLIWVDKLTGEIRFDSKKNRDDHRHHAIDAITIAYTELGFLQKLSRFNGQLDNYRRSKDERPVFEKPWNSFTEDVQQSVEKIIVSYRKNERILSKISKTIVKNGKKYTSIGYAARGRLHREFYFGKHPGKESTTNNEAYHIRKSVTSILNSKHVEKIVDDGIKQLIYNRLREVYNINPLSQYTLPADFFFNNEQIPQLYLPNKNGDPVPIKKVRVREVIGNAVQLKSNINQWVNPYNNHHVVIYEDINGDLKESIVSFWEVVERKNQNHPTYILPENGKKIVATLKENDMFLMGLPEEYENLLTQASYHSYTLLSPYLYRVQKISSMYYTFRHHLASTIENPQEELSIRSMGRWKELKPIKVELNEISQLKLLTNA